MYDFRKMSLFYKIHDCLIKNCKIIWIGDMQTWDILLMKNWGGLCFVTCLIFYLMASGYGILPLCLALRVWEQSTLLQCCPFSRRNQEQMSFTGTQVQKKTQKEQIQIVESWNLFWECGAVTSSRVEEKEPPEDRSLFTWLVPPWG